ncbi:hypothetical protein C7S20_00040 [Christiangramia fulva]|uniref:Uncharacterized protein n=1 Tax=Christiangramia fulva TaxID=2126553 RepID=A0A2R3Z0M2_9FLAO|nr:hypothetical protein [Christiangramia fulva]AVR43788.1 hypothetical protein C7S20_00040 [Christiangramia fulva]
MDIRITDSEIKEYWTWYDKLILKWNLVSFFGFITTAVIWAFILKHVFKVKTKFWLLNDTKDGDWGDPKELAKKRLLLKENAPALFKWFIKLDGAIWWWLRNHSWNYISRYKPEWNGGSNEGFEIIKNTTPFSNEYIISRKGIFEQKGIYTWLTKHMKIEGELEVAYIVNGKLECRYSKVWKDIFGRWHQKQKGSGGQYYRCNRKPLL